MQSGMMEETLFVCKENRKSYTHIYTENKFMLNLNIFILRVSPTSAHTNTHTQNHTPLTVN